MTLVVEEHPLWDQETEDRDLSYREEFPEFWKEITSHD